MRKFLVVDRLQLIQIKDISKEFEINNTNRIWLFLKTLINK